MDDTLALFKLHQETGKVAISRSLRGGISIRKGSEGDYQLPNPALPGRDVQAFQNKQPLALIGFRVFRSAVRNFACHP